MLTIVVGCAVDAGGRVDVLAVVPLEEVSVVLGCKILADFRGVVFRVAGLGGEVTILYRVGASAR